MSDHGGRSLTDDDVLAVRPDDPYLRWRLERHPLLALAVDGDHLGYVRRTPKGENWATLVGEDPSCLAALLAHLDNEVGVDGITVPEAAYAHVPESQRGRDPGHWSLWFLDNATPVRPSRAVALDDDDPRIAPLLVHSPSSYIGPDHPDVRRWVGVVEGDRLVSVGAHLVDRGDAAHLVSICTDPSERGRGAAAEVVSGLVRAARSDGCPIVELEMYVANSAGASLYRRLGFVEHGRYFSWLIASGSEPSLVELLA